MGFDSETRDGHHIYWLERRTVTVERSVKFNFDDNEVNVGVLPLEGESRHVEQQSNITQPIPETAETPIEAPDAENIAEPDIVEPTEPTEGRGRRIQKESEYVKMLREGTGVTGEKLSLLPKGMQTSSMSTVVADVAVEDYVMAMVVESVEGLMPTYEEACRCPDWPKWDEAIQKELGSLKKSSTWEIVERPKGANIVDNRWVLHIKKNAAGEIEKYKARLVAKGFTQIYGIDYYETYAPVTKLPHFDSFLHLQLVTVGQLTPLILIQHI